MNSAKNFVFKAAQHVNFHLVPVYLIALLFLSLHYMISVVGNFIFLSYIVSHIRRRRTFKDFSKTIVSLSICNLITFHVMPAGYAELLPWEVVLHVFLHLSSFYFYYCYKEMSNHSDKRVFDLKIQDNYFQYKT